MAQRATPRSSFTYHTQHIRMALQAVIEIQRRLPNARILYVSATGATESANLGYMQRLGLWGPGTAFESRNDFVHLLEQRGVGKMLLCTSPVVMYPPEVLILGAMLCKSVLYSPELCNGEQRSSSPLLLMKLICLLQDACDHSVSSVDGIRTSRRQTLTFKRIGQFFANYSSIMKLCCVQEPWSWWRWS